VKECRCGGGTVSFVAGSYGLGWFGVLEICVLGGDSECSWSVTNSPPSSVVVRVWKVDACLVEGGKPSGGMLGLCPPLRLYTGGVTVECRVAAPCA